MSGTDRDPALNAANATVQGSHPAAPPADVSALRLSMRYDEGVGPIIVLLHGINADASDWRPVIDRIGPEYRCIAFDLLGFGESPKPLDIDYSASEHALVIENSLRDAGIAEQFVLVGYSLGGDIAVRYAATYPDRLRRLFLLSTPFYLPAGQYARKGFSGQMIQAMLMRGAWSWLARGKRDNTPVYELASGRLEPFAKQFLRTDSVPTHWSIMAKNLVNCISATTMVDDMPKLTMPTVFAMGIRDPIVRPDQTPALQRMKPDLEIRRIVGLAADHMLLIEVPDKVADEIVRDEVNMLHVAHRAGSGEPLLVLVGPESAEAWRPAADVLARAHDVALVELMGFGESPAPPTARYDMGDHVAAVRATVRKLWPDRPPLRVVGHGLAGTVALGLAASAGDSVSRVFAFSPSVCDPGHTAEQSAHSETSAARLAAREQVAALAADEAARGAAGEALERRIIPLYRTLESVAFTTDPAVLVARASARVRLVLPVGDADAPREWARGEAAAGRIELSEPDGAADAVFDRPRLAVDEIAPALATQAGALTPGRKKGTRGVTLDDLTRSVDRRFVVRGLASAALGLVLLSRLTVGPVWIARGFAVWVAFSAISTVIGAIGLRRDGKSGWLPWALMGAVSAAFAAFLLLDETLAVRVFGFWLIGWVLWRSFADLFVAWKAADTPGPRWILWLKGAFGLLIAVIAVFVSPVAGGRLLRVVAGSYLVGSGVLLAAYGAQLWWRSRRRVRAILAGGRAPRAS